MAFGKATSLPPWWVIAGILFIYGVKGLWNWTRRRSRESSAQGWPLTEATIQSSYVVIRYRDDSRYRRDSAIPVLQYSYVVQGERYSGSANLGVWDGDRDSATDTGQRWLGEKIRVRYKPSDPAVSVWLTEDGAPAGVRSALPEGTDDGMIDLQLNK